MSPDLTFGAIAGIIRSVGYHQFNSAKLGRRGAYKTRGAAI